MDTAWSVGTFGAVAEFTRDAEETVAFDRGAGAISVVTARGGMRIDAHHALRPIASGCSLGGSDASRSFSRFRRQTARALGALIRTFFLSCCGTNEPTQPRKPCRRDGFRAPTSIRRIRCGTRLVIVYPSDRSATRLSRRSWPATVTRNSRHQAPRCRVRGRGADAAPGGLAADRFALAAVRVALRGALAALMLPVPAALLVVAVAWIVNQAIGFGVLGYPIDAGTMLWGLAIGAAALIATAMSALVLRFLPRAGGPAVLGLILIAAYAAYEVVLFAFTPALGGAGSFTLEIIARIGLLNVMWMIGLVAACQVFRLLIHVRWRQMVS